LWRAKKIFSAAASATAVVSDPPLPSVVDLQALRHPLKARDHRHLAFAQRLEDAPRVDVLDARPRVLSAGAHPGLQARKRYRRHAHALEAHRDQRRCDRLAVCDEHVELTRGRLGVDALRESDHAIRRVAHR